LVGQPAKIGKYDVLRLIGRGGMGVVYEALDPKLERHVAIKMILGATPGLLARFDREARSTGSLQHQNIVTIYEFGDQEGSPYLVMEYLEGMSLDTAISTGRALSLATKLSICVDVCNGLNYAHDRGIIHRDIKPGNVMLLEDGSVKIVDFGIARIGDTGASRTEVVGSLHYMSPEQFQSLPLDRRTDIFSTGVVLYQMLTGALPFQAAGGEAAVMYRIINEDPAPLSSYLQDYPVELDEILRKALAKNRDLRYPSARDLAFDLMAVVDREKRQEVQQWMKRADLAMQRTEWTKAEESLRQVLKVDKHHTPAHQLLSQVQVRIREQRKVDQVRQLRIQADEAFLDRRYDDALRTIDQAVSIDETNKDLLSLRASIQEARSRASRLKLALRRAEEAHHAGDLEEAKLAVREALELDPYETSAKALQVVILKQVEEQQRQQQLRQLFDSARDQIAARNLTAAFQTLKQAEQVDPSSVELYSLMKVISTAREEQLRKSEMEKLTRDIEEALNREDYAAAVAIADEGLQRQPRDQGLLKLKALAEKQQQRVQLKAFARDQFLAANGLLEVGRTSEALSTIENALRTIPGDTQLERLRDMVKDRLAADEAEGRKRHLLGRAQEMAAAEKFDEAVRVLESLRRDFPGSEEIEPLLERTRAAAKYAQTVAQALDRAQRLLSQNSTEQAVQFLEEKTLELSDARLFDLLEKARRQREKFQSGLQGSIEEGERILQTHGATEAARYLAAQPTRYREIAEFHAFAEVVSNRMAVEALDQELMGKTDPDSQVLLAEAALRANPGNEEIKKRLVTVRSRKEQIHAIAEKARTLEASRQYSEAAKELQPLRQLYPQYPSLEPEIRRLERLQEQRLSEGTRPQLEQFQLALQRAIEEGKRILQRHGASEATEYLGTQPSKYRETQEFRAFAEVVAKRAAWEALDRDLAGNPDADAQMRLAEEALRQNPGNEEIGTRLAVLRRRKEQISAIAENAHALEASRQYSEAAKELQQLRQLHPQYPNLESEIRRLEQLEEQRSSEAARRKAEQFQLAVRGVIEEGQRILQKRGASETAKYLGTQPATYREAPEFRAFADVVAKRVAGEALDQELAANTDPDAQVRSADAALRANPANEEIKKRLAAVRSRREQVNTIVEKVRALEGSRRYGKAAKELQKMRALYPQYPSLEPEIQRLEGLEEQSKQPQRAVETAKTKVDRPSVDHHQPEVGATVIMGQPQIGRPRTGRPMEEPPADLARPAAPPAPPAARVVRPSAIPHEVVEPDLGQVSPRAYLSSKTWLIAAVVAIVVVAGVALVYVLNSRPTTVLVKVNPTPEDSTVVVDGVSCPVPCQLPLSPGKHVVAADHDGYITVTQSIQVPRGGSPSYSLTLSPIEQPIHNNTREGGGDTAESVPHDQGKGAKGGKVQAQGHTSGSGLSTKTGSNDTKGPTGTPSLQPNSGGSTPTVAEVVIRNLPPMAHVRVEGGDTHQADGSGIARFSVPVGNHMLDITADGYTPRTIQQTFAAGGPALDVSLALDPEQQEWSRLESSTDSGALQAFLRKYPAGKHTEQAKEKLDKLDKLASSKGGGSTGTVSKPPVNLTDSGMIPDTTGQPERDKTAILGVLKAYEKSYEAQDLEGLQKLWPTMNAKTIQGIADFFKTTNSIKLTSIVTDDPKIAGNEATLAFKQETSYVMNGRFKKTPAAKVNMKLKKTSPQGSWHIDTIN
jgi:tetratricopeptide (TPR) repeat protein